MVLNHLVALVVFVIFCSTSEFETRLKTTSSSLICVARKSYDAESHITVNLWRMRWIVHFSSHAVVVADVVWIKVMMVMMMMMVKSIL